MEYDGRIPIDGPSLSLSPSSFHHETLWQMNLGANETMEAVTYPVRDGETDCSYYIRTGLCRFGATCRFNHPPNRKLAIASARMMGEYPERPGQPECQYYLKTGTCKFGATCKFHHPRDKAGIAGQVPVNVLGLPLRPNEPECAYYLRTGQCKFGNTCKFHHPQPSNMMVPMRGSPVYPPAQSPTPPGQQSYAGGLTNWPLMGTSFIPSPRWQGPSNYAPLMVPQGVVSMPAWKTYNGEPSSASSPDHQQTQGNIQMYGGSGQNEATNMGSQEGPISSYRTGSVPVGYYPMQRESIFPERPGQPECQFYMKTGDCKFGGVCRFHHPRERLVPPPDCVLSPLGLPLRSGEPLCIFYTRYGICKFGPSCKFDHPMGVFAYNNATLSSAEPSGVSHHLMRTSSGPSRLSEGLMDASSANPRRISLSESRQMPSGDDTVNTDE